MDDKNHTICLHITDELINSPCGQFFNRPVDPENDGVPDYFKVISYPMDLSTVRSKLERKYYRKINDWMNDVNKIWENAIRFNGENSYITFLAKLMKQRFIKLCVLSGRCLRSDYIQFLKECYSTINTLLSKPPEVLKPFLSDKDFTNLYKESDVITLVNSLNSMFGNAPKSDIIKLLQVLQMNGVQIDTKDDEISVGLTNLPPAALKALLVFRNSKSKRRRQQNP